MKKRFDDGPCVFRPFRVVFNVERAPGAISHDFFVEFVEWQIGSSGVETLVDVRRS